ncbi:MAG: hypothetical protein H7175_02445, partial [Burkholderiales bacterium]|nr:hypothetical protein [Anaerolineae bacterium]
MAFHQPHGFSLRRLWSQITLITALLLAGCASAGGATSSIQLLGPRSADDVVRDFLSAWNNLDYSAMYGLLSPQSREIVAADEFVVTYEDTTAVLGLTGVQFDVRDAQVQGQSAAVSYDVTLQSNVFGEVADAGRTMRLVQSPDGWRVAWSTMDIFDVLVSGSRLTVDADRQPRANILDRNGNVLVEQGGTVITLYAIRQTIPNEADCAVLLGDVLQKQPDDILVFFAPYAAETLFYVGEVDPETERQYDAQLTELCNITPNLRIERQTRRYVGHGAASHVTGYISTIPADQLETYLSQGYRESDLVGLAGIEQAYDQMLGGQASQTLRIVESGGVTLRELAGAEGIEPQQVTLTVDRDLQLAAARAISDAYNYAQTSWGSLSPGTGVVVIDVNTGAILALASYPTFEPAIFNP